MDILSYTTKQNPKLVQAKITNIWTSLKLRPSFATMSDSRIKRKVPTNNKLTDLLN